MRRPCVDDSPSKRANTRTAPLAVVAAPRGNQTRGWSEEAKCYSRVAQKSAGRWASAQKHVRARRPRVSRGANVCRPVSWTFRDIPKQAPWESNSRHAQSLQGSATVGKRDLQYHLQKRACLPCRVVLCRAVSCRAVPCRAMSYHVVPCRGGRRGRLVVSLLFYGDFLG